MSILEQKSFISSIHPFEKLTNDELDILLKILMLFILKKMK